VPPPSRRAAPARHRPRQTAASFMMVEWRNQLATRSRPIPTFSDPVSTSFQSPVRSSGQAEVPTETTLSSARAQCSEDVGTCLVGNHRAERNESCRRAEEPLPQEKRGPDSIVEKRDHSREHASPS